MFSSIATSAWNWPFLSDRTKPLWCQALVHKCACIWLNTNMCKKLTHTHTILEQIKSHSHSRIHTACDHVLDALGAECTISCRRAFNATRCAMWQLCFQIGWITLQNKQRHTHSLQIQFQQCGHRQKQTPHYCIIALRATAILWPAQHSCCPDLHTAWLPNGEPFKK